MLVLSLSGAERALRMRLWRSLRSCGAAVLRDGVYLLPNSDAAQTAFDAQARAVIDAGGIAHVLSFDARDEEGLRFRALFDRREAYQTWFVELHSCLDELAEMGEAAARREEGRLKRSLDGIVEIDFFPEGLPETAREAFDEFRRQINHHFSPDEPLGEEGVIEPKSMRAYQGRRWATRARLWVDRVASAWLIRRFIDEQAEFIWLQDPRQCPRDAVGFDFDGAEFTHVGEKVTFEVLLASFGLDSDPAFSRLAAVIRYLDVGGIPVEDAAGLLTMLAGTRESHADDFAFVEAASALFDALYQAYRLPQETTRV